MKATNVTSVGIIPEVLTFDNYEKWSVVMKKFLMGQGLWDGVSGDSFLYTKTSEIMHLSNKKSRMLDSARDTEQGLDGAYETQIVSEAEGWEISWKTNNAKALHIIQLSCERQIQDELSAFELAKDAWDHLSTRYGNFVKIKPDKDHQVSGLSEEHKELLRMVERGESIDENTNIDQEIYDKITFASDRTLLHIAVITENVKNVKKLVTEGTDKFVKKKDALGHTALALAARYNRETNVVEFMVDSKKGKPLLTMENEKKELPVHLAAANGHKEMTSYLYEQTIGEKFDGDPKYRVLLLERCIQAEIFDVALKLLTRYKNLVSEASSPKSVNQDLPGESSESSALVALAKLHHSFPSSNRFTYGEQFIYDSISVEKESENQSGTLKLGIPKFVELIRCGAISLYRWFLSSLSVPSFRTLALAFLYLPLNLIRLLFLGYAYMSFRINKWRNSSQMQAMKKTKYSHYQVLEILKYFSESIKGFDDIQLREASAYEAMLYAAQNGIIEFINAMREANPDLLSVVDNSNRGIFWYAIQNRRRNVFKLIHSLNGLEMEMFANQKDTFGNNLLHIAGYFDPLSNRGSRSGPAMQIQKEIRWFKSVQRVMHPKCKEAKNKDGKKPYDVFLESHDELLKATEKWTKDIAHYYITVASLILTIMFAAIFTIPAAKGQQIGNPIYVDEKIFFSFVYGDVMCIFMSSFSLLFFIRIHSLRYTDIDFLDGLPAMLQAGLMLLTGSVGLLMATFYNALCMILEGHPSKYKVILGPVVMLCAFPMILLLTYQMIFVYKTLSLQ